ncbi:SAGA complex subunit Sgf73, partial [Teratosphaeriaceae sp. CCFEE 6253]
PSTTTDDSNGSLIPGLDTLFDDFATTKASLKDTIRQDKDTPPKPASSKKALPPMNPIPTTLARAFPTGRLLADLPNVLKCNHCKRPVLAHAMPAHITSCLNKKQEKLRKKKEAKDARDAAARRDRRGGVEDSEEEGAGEGGEDGAAGKKTATNGVGGGTGGKKRKAGPDDTPGDVEGPARKKKKKKPNGTAAADPAATAANGKANKAARPKAPVDVERQCGVELPLGGQCAR